MDRALAPTVAARLMIVVVLAAGLVVSIVLGSRSAPKGAAVAAATLPPSTSVPPTTEAPPIGPVALTGCPPPPGTARPTPSQPWHPAVLVPEASLPQPAPPAARTASLGALDGKGVWIWKWDRTEHGDAAAVVAKAAAAGLTQLWVRVGDTRNGFYAADVLNQLLPAAHAKGIAVVGWGFPHLYDPAADAAWSTAALNWTTADGEALDGFSPDIETSTEGTALTARRATLYLSLIRAAAGERPIVATVFPPTEKQLATYPYAAIAPYVDAFAPMVYWGCREPGDAAADAMAHLAAMAPVHLIGQGYDMAPEGGRTGAPSGQEISRFCDVARRSGALGCSLWVWQTMTQDHWDALTAYPWGR